MSCFKGQMSESRGSRCSMALYREPCKCQPARSARPLLTWGQLAVRHPESDDGQTRGWWNPREGP